MALLRVSHPSLYLGLRLILGLSLSLYRFVKVEVKVKEQVVKQK